MGKVVIVIVALYCGDEASVEPWYMVQCMQVISQWIHWQDSARTHPANVGEVASVPRPTGASLTALRRAVAGPARPAQLWRARCSVPNPVVHQQHRDAAALRLLWGIARHRVLSTLLFALSARARLLQR
jgi:hypothetical protein